MDRNTSCNIEPIVEPVPDSTEHLKKEVEWYKKRMSEYRASFFRICDIVEHSDCHNIIKQLIKEERSRY